MAPNKMQGHFWHQFLTQCSMPFQMVPSVLLFMVALIATYFIESDWLLKNLHQSESGSKSYHGKQNWGYHVKEHTKLCQKQLSEVTLHFVWGQLSKKQTVYNTVILKTCATQALRKDIPFTGVVIIPEMSNCLLFISFESWSLKVSICCSRPWILSL